MKSLSIPFELIRDPRLDFEALGALVYMTSFGLDGRVSAEKLAEDRGLAVADVIRVLDRISEAGYMQEVAQLPAAWRPTPVEDMTPAGV